MLRFQVRHFAQVPRPVGLQEPVQHLPDVGYVRRKFQRILLEGKLACVIGHCCQSGLCCVHYLCIVRGAQVIVPHLCVGGAPVGMGTVNVGLDVVVVVPESVTRRIP